MLDLRELAKFSMCCRSFYWIAGRKQLLEKFCRFNIETYRQNKRFIGKFDDDKTSNIAYESWRQNATPRSAWGRKGPIAGTAPQSQHRKIIDQIQSWHPSNKVSVIIIENNYYNNGGLDASGDLEAGRKVTPYQPQGANTFEWMKNPMNSTRTSRPNYQPIDIITD